MKHRRAGIVAALFVFLVVLAACGQGQPPGKSAPTASPTGAAPAKQFPLEAGESLYQANCLVCHGDREGKGATAGASPHNETGHTWHHPDAQLKEWVLNGRLFLGMPAFKDKLTEADVEAVLVYLKTWWTPEQRESQADISRRYQEALEKSKQR